MAKKMGRQWERIRAEITRPKVTNREFAADNKEFKAACERVGLEPTGRQASKWEAGKGLAYKEGRK